MARNTPMTPAKTNIRFRWKNPTRSLISLQEATTDMMPRNAVSRTISRLSPSMAR